MKWGEHIDQVKGDNTFLRNKDGRPAQLQRDYGKLIITLATTGNINTRENNKDLPCSPQEMADQMHECIKLGVSILHIHSRNELLKPTMRVDKFRETCRLVKERDPDVIIQISTGGRAPPTAFEGVDVGDWRMDPLNLLPEMGSYTPGSVNLGPIVYQNDAKLTRDMAQKYKDLKIKPQVEVFDTNMISNVCGQCPDARRWRMSRREARTNTHTHTHTTGTPSRVPFLNVARSRRWRVRETTSPRRRRRGHQRAYDGVRASDQRRWRETPAPPRARGTKRRQRVRARRPTTS